MAKRVIASRQSPLDGLDVLGRSRHLSRDTQLSGLKSQWARSSKTVAGLGNGKRGLGKRPTSPVEVEDNISQAQSNDCGQGRERCALHLLSQLSLARISVMQATNPE